MQSPGQYLEIGHNQFLPSGHTLVYTTILCNFNQLLTNAQFIKTSSDDYKAGKQLARCEYVLYMDI
jgi:hypothetical protein